jgi:hypothetical protein
MVRIHLSWSSSAHDSQTLLRRSPQLQRTCARAIDARMPEKQTLERARRDKRQGKSTSTQAGEFVREQIRHIRQGKHGAKSTKQAIAIGLSEARRAGVKLRPPARGKVSESSRRSAISAYRKGQRHEPIDRNRSQARSKALRNEPRAAASHRALSRQAHSAARRRGAKNRSIAARKAARTRARSRH